MGGFIDNEISDDHAIRKPFSHAAGYEACPRTDLVACADIREDVMAAFGERYNIPRERQYTDYQRLIEVEQPDTVSVATQPEQRAEIVIHAADHGAKAIYAEKAMAASMSDASAMLAAVERNGCAFNMGTNRRWEPGFTAMRQAIDDGAIGALRSLIVYHNGTLFNMSSHMFDAMFWLCGDRRALSAQASLVGCDDMFDGFEMRGDPIGHGIIEFEDDVTGYALLTPRGLEVEAIGEAGSVECLQGMEKWQIRVGSSEAPLAGFEPASSTLAIVEDLVHSLDTGEPTRGGVQVAYRNTELIFAFIESHRRGGERVALPLEDCKYRLARNRKPNQPRVQPKTA